jgi:AraC-like DNA-binding protein
MSDMGFRHERGWSFNQASMNVTIANGTRLSGMPLSQYERDWTRSQDQVLICLFRYVKVALGHLNENFMRGSCNLLDAPESGNWHLLYTEDILTLFRPEQTLTDIVAAFRHQHSAQGNQPDAPKALFVSLSAAFSAKIGLNNQSASTTNRHPSVDSARRLERHLLEWARKTVCSLALSEPANADNHTEIEKEIEFAVYDLVGHTRGNPKSALEQLVPPLEFPFLAGRRQILEIVIWMRENLADSSLCATKVAKQFRISVRQLHKLFELTEDGMTFLQTMKSMRLQQACNLLETPEYWHLSIADIAEKSGFGGSVYFGRTFRQHYKISPGSYRKQKMDAFMQQYALMLAAHGKLDGLGAPKATDAEPLL